MSKQYYGIKCEKCGKAAFFYSINPLMGEAILSKFVVPLPGNNKPNPEDKMQCQFCNTPIINSIKRLFEYPSGEEICLMKEIGRK